MNTHEYQVGPPLSALAILFSSNICTRKPVQIFKLKRIEGTTEGHQFVSLCSTMFLAFLGLTNYRLSGVYHISYVKYINLI